MPSIRSFSIPNTGSRKPSIFLTQASLENEESMKSIISNLSIGSESSVRKSSKSNKSPIFSPNSCSRKSSLHAHVPKRPPTKFPFSSSSTCISDCITPSYAHHPYPYSHMAREYRKDISKQSSGSLNSRKKKTLESARHRQILNQVVDTWTSVSEPHSPHSLGSGSKVQIS